MDYTSELREKLDTAIEALERNFTKVRAGRANPAILDDVMIEYYGSPTPLRSIANISVPEARQLLIRPFDKSLLGNIERAIYESNIGLTPNNDGENIRLIIPPLTEERRKDLTKQVKLLAEEGKIAIRNIRRDIIGKLKDNDLSEDSEKRALEQLQKIIDDYNKTVDELLTDKEKELMSV
ncbi:MAG: ribosome recycling factor [Bacilli bacterium]|nr:ribosome recycling factor [Bacilli bacterium]